MVVRIMQRITLLHLFTANADAQEAIDTTPRPVGNHGCVNQAAPRNSEDWQALLEARVARLQAETGLTGVAAAVMTDGQSAAVAASGERRRGSGIPVAADDRWHVGSITKSMTATLLAVLEDDGRVSPHDTLPALLPDVAMAGGWSCCTSHHLLTHTAGAPANFPNKVQSVWPDTGEELVAARRGAASSPMFSSRNPGTPAVSATLIPTSATSSLAILPRRLPANPTKSCCRTACSPL